MNGFNRTFALLISILGFAGGYMYYSQIANPGIEPVPPAPVSADDNLGSFRDFDLSFEFADNEQYKSLKTFGEFPVTPGTLGKKDIFAPF